VCLIIKILIPKGAKIAFVFSESRSGQLRGRNDKKSVLIIKI